jgi:methyl-accepting chemotaxis protein
MNSIGSKIRTALTGSIVIIAGCSLIMLLINQINTYNSNSIITTMTTEYSVISLTQDLIQEYNNICRNPGNKQLTVEYTKIKTKLTTTLTQLKNTITYRESAVLFIGVENTVKNVLKSCDAGLLEIRNNNFQNLSNYYADANKGNVYVAENTMTLIQKELEHLSQTQQNAQKYYLITLFGSLGIFIVIVLITTVYAKSFSKQLLLPLTNLTVFAKDIADGKLEVANKVPAETTDDEIGSLSKSIHIMVTNLIDSLNKKQQANEEIVKANTSREQKTKELEEMNKLMVGRELKMAELKKEIAELQERLSHQNQ